MYFGRAVILHYIGYSVKRSETLDLFGPHMLMSDCYTLCTIDRYFLSLVLATCCMPMPAHTHAHRLKQIRQHTISHFIIEFREFQSKTAVNVIDAIFEMNAVSSWTRHDDVSLVNFFLYVSRIHNFNANTQIPNVLKQKNHRLSAVSCFRHCCCCCHCIILLFGSIFWFLVIGVGVGHFSKAHVKRVWHSLWS